MGRRWHHGIHQQDDCERRLLTRRDESPLCAMFQLLGQAFTSVGAPKPAAELPAARLIVAG